jgi:hypothetical protein
MTANDMIKPVAAKRGRAPSGLADPGVARRPVRRGRASRFAAAAVWLLAALPPPAQAERVATAVPCAQPPVLDGRLDDACWANAPVVTAFTQVLPVEGAPPSERTEVRFAFTADYLYVAVRCFDAEPGRILASQLRRDASFDSDDYVAVVFDTFARAREGYLFSVNPAGARRDALFGKFSELNVSWDALWDARARVDESGWSAEIAIPCKSLSFDPRAEAWRWNIERHIRRKQETVRWAGLARTKSITALEDFGELRGLGGLRQGLGLEVRPYVRSTHTDQGAGGAGSEFKSGLDVTWRVTPTLTAVATVNTDFAETEVDGRVVSLSRFPVFFPEKRDFFLQDASLFGFGGLPADSSPYYSRRIGTGVDGRPVDIRFGGRITGRVGGTSLALLDVQQAAHAGIEAKNLAVARVAQQVLAESSIGGIFTRGNPRANGDAWLGGVDFNYQNSRLPGDRLLTGNLYVMHSEADRGGGDPAWGFDIDFPNEPLNVHLYFRHWGGQFEPALGFVDRTGIREFIASARHTWRPNTRWLRRVDLSGRPYFTTDLEPRIVAEDHDVPTLTFESPAGDKLTLGTTYYRDVLAESFSIWPGVVLPTGDYGYWQFKPSLQTSLARTFNVGLNFRHGGFYSGRQTGIKIAFGWRPSRHVNLSAAWEEQHMRLPEGNFDVRIASLRLDLGLTPGLTWSTLAQYDNRSDRLGLDSRVRWTWRPGNDLFLVVSQLLDYDDARFARLATEATLKTGMTFRF